MPRLPKGQQSGVGRVAVDVQERVRVGKLQPGDPVPSSTELATLHDVHESTAARALRELADEGLLTRQGPGRPLVVAQPGREEAQERALRQVAITSNRLAKAHAETVKHRAAFDDAVRAAGAAGVSAAEIARRVPLPMERVPKLDAYTIQALARREEE